jgi:hypothetical protein
MSAASKPAATPLFREGNEYWEDLVRELKHHLQRINHAVSRHGCTDEDLVRWLPGPGIHMLRSRHPSTGIRADLEFRSWGPVISGTITGYQDQDYRFFPEEFEILVARDLDGSVVAIFDEGRSFSPQELAAYLVQHFRRCFPEISLPVEERHANPASVRELEAVSSA